MNHELTQVSVTRYQVSVFCSRFLLNELYELNEPNEFYKLSSSVCIRDHALYVSMGGSGIVNYILLYISANFLYS